MMLKNPVPVETEGCSDGTAAGFASVRRVAVCFACWSRVVASQRGCDRVLLLSRRSRVAALALAAIGVVPRSGRGRWRQPGLGRRIL